MIVLINKLSVIIVNLIMAYLTLVELGEAGVYCAGRIS